MSTESGGSDPDAPWRKGFDGWQEKTVETESAGDGIPERPGPAAAPSPPTAGPSETSPDPAASPGRGGRGRAWIVAGLAVLAAVAVVAAMVYVRTGEGSAATTSAPTLPESVDGAWTLALDRVIDDVAIADDVVVVGASGGLTVYDLADGDEVWSRPELLGGRDIDIDRIALVEDRILVQITSSAGSDVRAFERATGDALWESDGGGGTYTILDATDRPSVLLRQRLEGRSVGQMIDTATGAPIGEPVSVSSVSATGRHLGVEPRDRQVAAWSTDTQEIVAGPVDSFGLAGVAPLGRALVGVDLEARIAAFDDEGVRTDELALTPVAGGGATVRADLLGVADGSTAVVGSDRSIGFTVDDGDIVVRWQADGRVSQLVEADWGTAGLLVRSDPGGVAQVAIVDAATGRTVALPAPGRERLPELAGNGYLVAPPTDATDRAVEAYDYDDRRMWSLPIAPGADYELLDDAVVVVESTLTSSMLTIAR